MIVYVAESRTAGGLAELVYQDDVSIAPTLSELSVNRTLSEINAVPICTVVRPCVSRCKTRRRRPRPVCRNLAIPLAASELLTSVLTRLPSENSMVENNEGSTGGGGPCPSVIHNTSEGPELTSDHQSIWWSPVHLDYKYK